MEIWSGGQTGVDRAALDAALDGGVRIGGWIPKGRLAEDGAVPLKYTALREAGTADYGDRTRLNVQETDATLVLSWGKPQGGTRDTIRIARELERRLMIIDLAVADPTTAAAQIREWLESFGEIARLNVAGPRASQAPRAYERALETMRRVLGVAGGRGAAGPSAGPPTR